MISDPAKVRAVETFLYPTTLKALETLVGFINYLADTIPQAAQLVAPLQTLKTELLKPAPYKGRQRCLYSMKTPIPAPTPEQQLAFDRRKAALTLNPKLQHFNSAGTDFRVYKVGKLLSMFSV